MKKRTEEYVSAVSGGEHRDHSAGCSLSETEKIDVGRYKWKTASILKEYSPSNLNEIQVSKLASIVPAIVTVINSARTFMLRFFILFTSLRFSFLLDEFIIHKGC